jgi:hypothetical protein
MKSRLRHLDKMKLEDSGCGLFNDHPQKHMKAKEAPNSNNMCHSYVLLAFPNSTLFSSCTRQVGATQYRGYDMGRKAGEWGSTASEGVTFLFTQTDSVEYQSSPLGTASVSLLEKRREREVT